MLSGLLNGGTSNCAAFKRSVNMSAAVLPSKS